MKKRIGKRLQINISNRGIYFLITLGIIIALSFGVYALNAGEKPNPGHTINETVAPAGCSANQYLKWTGTDWACTRDSCNWVCDDDYQVSSSQIARFSSPVCAPYQIATSYTTQSYDSLYSAEYNDDLIIDAWVTPVNTISQAYIVDVRDIESPYSHRRIVCVLCCSGIVNATYTYR